MTVQEIRNLPIEEKLKIMDALWDDMRSHYENLPIPHEVRKLLHHRKRRVSEGKAKLLKWDDVKFATKR